MSNEQGYGSQGTPEQSARPTENRAAAVITPGDTTAALDGAIDSTTPRDEGIALDEAINSIAGYEYESPFNNSSEDVSTDASESPPVLDGYAPKPTDAINSIRRFKFAPPTSTNDETSVEANNETNDEPIDKIGNKTYDGTNDKSSDEPNDKENNKALGEDSGENQATAVSKAREYEEEEMASDKYESLEDKMEASCESCLHNNALKRDRSVMNGDIEDDNSGPPISKKQRWRRIPGNIKARARLGSAGRRSGMQRTAGPPRRNPHSSTASAAAPPMARLSGPPTKRTSAHKEVPANQKAPPIYSEQLRKLDTKVEKELTNFCLNQVLDNLEKKMSKASTQTMKPSTNALRLWSATPQAFRFFYSRIISKNRHGRYTMANYGFAAVLNSAGLNPFQDRWVYQFPDELKNAAKYLARRLKYMGYRNLDFNHVEVKTYVPGNHNSKIGPHRDCDFDLKGKQKEKDTSDGDHPIVTVTIGGSRTLYFTHRKSRPGTQAKSKKEYRIKTFPQHHGDIFLLKPSEDEKPHFWSDATDNTDEAKEDLIHTLHWADCKGNTNSRDISFALVFRKVTTTGEFTSKGKYLFSNEEEKNKMKRIRRQRKTELEKMLKNEKQSTIEERVKSFIDEIEEAKIFLKDTYQQRKQ